MTPPDSQRDAIAESGPSAGAEPPRSWWQFSLRTMFVLLTLAAIGLAWFFGGPERQRRLVKEIDAFGAIVVYPGEEPYTYNPQADTGWIPRDYYQPVEAVGIVERQFADDTLELVAQLPVVKEVLLESVNVSERGMLALTSHSGIERVLSTWSLDNSLLPHLRRLPRLRALILTERGLTDEGMWFFDELKSLEELDIQFTSISDIGLTYLRRLKKLRELQLPESITDTGLAYLAELDALERLEISGCPIVGPGLAYLARLPALRRLNLASTLIGDDAIPHLLQIKSLERIDLSRTQVTIAAVKSLLALPKLETVVTDGLELPPAELTAFREALWKRRGGPVEPNSKE